MRQAPHMGTKGLTIAATITLGVLTTTSAALGIPALIEVSHTAKAEKTAESSTSPEAPGDAPGGAEHTTPPAEAAPPADQPIQTPAEPSSPDDENTPPGEMSSPDEGTSENEQPETPSDDKNGDTENTPPKKSESGKKTEPDTQESSDCNCKKHRTHVVQEHDTLSSISTQYGVSVDAIMKANKLRDADMIYTGSTLRIPD